MRRGKPVTMLRGQQQREAPRAGAMKLCAARRRALRRHEPMRYAYAVTPSALPPDEFETPPPRRLMAPLISMRSRRDRGYRYFAAFSASSTPPRRLPSLPSLARLPVIARRSPQHAQADAMHNYHAHRRASEAARAQPIAMPKPAAAPVHFDTARRGRGTQILTRMPRHVQSAQKPSRCAAVA